MNDNDSNDPANDNAANIPAEESEQTVNPIDGSPQDVSIEAQGDVANVPTSEKPEIPEPLPVQTLAAPKKKYLTKKYVIPFVFIIVIIVFVLCYFIIFNKEEDTKANTKQTEQAQQETEKDTVHPDEVVLQPTVAANAKAVWDATPTMLPTQPLFDEAGFKEYYGGELPQEESTFFKSGTDGSKDIIIFKIPSYDMGSQVGVAVKDGDSYKIIAKNSKSFISSQDGSYIGPKLAAGVTLDETIAYDGITPLDSITLNGISASRSSEWDIETDMTNATEVTKIPEGTVYERIYQIEGQEGIKQYYLILKQPSHTYVKYRYATSVLKDDNSATIAWNNGTTTTSSYQWAMVWGGCGSIGSVNVLDKKYTGDLIEVGKTNGQTVYTLNNATHPVMNTVYKNYNSDGSVPSAPTQQQMYDDKGVIVVRNELGYRVVLVGDKYQRAGECGKPVIYLYPTKPTQISVGVGANITKSEPTYNKGWNVIALPSGKLISGSGMYDYLFWEGIGHGNYPQITEGFVVKRSDVEKTLWEHLDKLGLNRKESQDFMEFWMPLIPNTDYVRLTWFGTQQMNELAPLTLSKKPDTLIRVFLDFEGLDNPTTLTPQRLSHPDRKGFTVIEWGGLLTKR